MKPLSFIDVETTGLEPEKHEMIQIAVIKVDCVTLEVLDEIETKIQPRHLERADPVALRINGYCPERWTNAITLWQALCQINPLIDGTILAGHNVAFDRAFLQAAWRHCKTEPANIDYHLFDTFVLASPLLFSGIIERLSLDSICSYFGIERDNPHCALSDAYCSLKIARRILPQTQMSIWFNALSSDERSIVESLLKRLHNSRRDYEEFEKASML